MKIVMNEKKIWKLFFYLKSITFFLSIIDLYFTWPIFTLLLGHHGPEIDHIKIKILRGGLLAVLLLIGAYYQFKPVLLYNLYLVLHSLTMAFYYIVNYDRLHTAHWGQIPIHHGFSMNDFINISDFVLGNIACLPGVILLFIYTKRWLKKLRLKTA